VEQLSYVFSDFSDHVDFSNNVFSDFSDQIVLELEPKNVDARN